MRSHRTDELAVQVPDLGLREAEALAVVGADDPEPRRSWNDDLTVHLISPACCVSPADPVDVMRRIAGLRFPLFRVKQRRDSFH
jgi:hypothetical protein